MGGKATQREHILYELGNGKLWKAASCMKPRGRFVGCAFCSLKGVSV